MICLRCISRRLEASEVAWRDPPGPGATELPVPATKPLGPVGPSPAGQTLCNPSLFQLAFRPPRPCEILRDTSEHLGRAQVGRQYFEMVGALGALGRVGTVHSRSCTVKASPPAGLYTHVAYSVQGSGLFAQAASSPAPGPSTCVRLSFDPGENCSCTSSRRCPTGWRFFFRPLW